MTKQEIEKLILDANNILKTFFEEGAGIGIIKFYNDIIAALNKLKRIMELEDICQYPDKICTRCYKAGVCDSRNDMLQEIKHIIEEDEG